MVGFHVCGPNEALIVTGCCYQAQPHFVIGSWTFVWPGIQRVQSLSLTTMSIELLTEQGITKHGVAVTVKGTALVKIDSGHKELLTLASQLFLGKTDQEISVKIKDTLQALQRSTIAQLTVEELISDREKLQNAAYEIMTEDLVKMGLTLVSYSVKDVKDCRLQVYCNLTSALKKSPFKNSLAVRKASEADQSIPEGDEEKAEEPRVKAEEKKIDMASPEDVTFSKEDVLSSEDEKLGSLGSGGEAAEPPDGSDSAPLISAPDAMLENDVTANVNDHDQTGGVQTGGNIQKKEEAPKIATDLPKTESEPGEAATNDVAKDVAVSHVKDAPFDAGDAP